MALRTHSLLPLIAALTLGVNLPVLAQTAVPKPIEIPYSVKAYPLPGSFDTAPTFNSNSPEIIQEEGILLSSLPDSDTANSPFLNHAFKGDFSVFSHHIAKDEQPGQRLLYLGLLATNQSQEPVRITLKQGASYLSQPDALFKKLNAFLPNPGAKIYAGPGDRVATELVADQSPFPPTTYEIPPRSTVVLTSLPVPTDVAILPPINGRSSLFHFQSDGSVYLSHIAAFAKKEGSSFTAPTLDDYRKILDSRKLAGPREVAPTPFDPADPPPSAGVRYGRVAGIVAGSRWRGNFFEKTAILQMPGPGERAAYPISALYMKRVGTTQNQSGKLLKRYPDTAYQSHGNYGAQYILNIPFNNPGPGYRSYALGFSSPARVEGSGASTRLIYQNPPSNAVMFRGSIRLEWVDEYKQRHDELTHLVLRHGEEVPPLAMFTVPPGGHYDMRVSLIYPADSTPPQVLTISRFD